MFTSPLAELPSTRSLLAAANPECSLSKRVALCIKSPFAQVVASIALMAGGGAQVVICASVCLTPVGAVGVAGGEVIGLLGLWVYVHALKRQSLQTEQRKLQELSQQAKTNCEHELANPALIGGPMYQVLSRALDNMPKVIARHMASQPCPSQALADAYGVSLEMLEAEYQQSLTQLLLFTLAQELNAWCSHNLSRQDRAELGGRIGLWFAKKVPEKLEAFYEQTADGQPANIDEAKLDTAISSYGLDPNANIASQAAVGVSQKESFLLGRLVKHALDHAVDVVVTNNGTRLASIASPSEDQLKFEEEEQTVKEFNDMFKFFDRQTKAMVHDLFQAYNRFVCSSGSGTPGLPQSEKIRAISHVLNSPAQIDHNADVLKFLEACKTIFTMGLQSILAKSLSHNSHLKNDEQRQAFFENWLVCFLQQFDRLGDMDLYTNNPETGKPDYQNGFEFRTATGQVAIDAALWTLEEQRQQRVLKPDELTLTLRQGLQGAIAGVLELSATMTKGVKNHEGEESHQYPYLTQMFEAYADNRMPVPWHDTRVLNEALRLYEPVNWNELAPEQKAPILNVLAAYGQETIKLLKGNSKPLRFVPLDKLPKKCTLVFRNSALLHKKAQAIDLKGFSPNQGSRIFPLKSKTYDVCAAKPRSSGKSQADKPKKYYSKRGSIFKFFLGYRFKGAAYFDVARNEIVVPDHYNGMRKFFLLAHELGHAIDAALAKKCSYMKWYFSQDAVGGFLKNEHEEAKANNQGITCYAQTNVLEHWAESCAAWVGFKDICGTYAEPGPEGIFSKSNLQRLHPLTFIFVDELVKHGSWQKACMAVEQVLQNPTVTELPAQA